MYTQLIADNDVTKEEIMDLEIDFAENTDNLGKPVLVITGHKL